MQLLRTFAITRDDMHLIKITREHEKLFKNVIENIGRACFWLIFCSMYENDKNQMNIANNLAIILKHVSTSTLATKCVVEMLGKNMELQEEKVTTKEIKIFVDMINKSKMNANYINLLRATCNCAGEGVDGNQGLVVEQFFEKHSKLTIKLDLDDVNRRECKWKQVEAYEADETTAGWEMKQRGLPAITVKWHDSFKDFSPIHLYAKSNVPLKEVVEILGDDDLIAEVRKKGGNAADMIEEATNSSVSKDTPARGNRKTMASQRHFRKTASARAFSSLGTEISTIQLRKLMVAEYFVSQIYLYAETCLDRNYISMQFLEERMSYNMLLTIIRDENLPDEFRAAVTCLMNCLYVDAYPQNMVRLPKLTRIWSKIDPESPTPLPSVEKSRERKFAFLQEAITEHLESLVEGATWNIFTRRLMESLMLLVKFRFYTSSSQVQYIVNPLIKSLDRRNAQDDVFEEVMQEAMSPFRRLTGRHSKINPEIAVITLPPWQVSMLKLMSGTSWMFGVLALVFLCLAVSGYQMAQDEEGFGYDFFEYITFSIFAIELLLRMHCWTVVKKKFSTFFKDKFHNLDVAVVGMDVIIIFISVYGKSIMPGNVGGFTKMLRIARVAKLFRILRAARLVNEMTKAKENLYPKWALPKRFNSTPEDQLSTMVEMVKALSEITRLSQDFSVSKVMNSFKLWQKGELKLTPTEIFENVIESSKELELDSSGELEHIFIDLCYYDYPDLVQNALQVLMVHHSTKRILLDNMKQVQLLTTSWQEELHDKLFMKLKLLEEHAEKSELWIEFESAKDFETCDEVMAILGHLTEVIKTDNETLEYGGDEAANLDIQNVLRNLGAFEVAATVLELAGELDDDENNDVDEDDSDGDESTVVMVVDEDKEDTEDAGSIGSKSLGATKSEKVHNILLLCNTFLTWFVRDNAENQSLAFRNLDLLQETIDDGIDSTRVIAQIFRKNEQLMKEFPESLIGEFAEKIATNGRNPDYLDLIESIVSFADFNQLSHQYAIIKEFTSNVRVKKTLYLCQDPSSKEYNERIEMMNIRGGKDATPPSGDDLEDENAEEHAKEMWAEAGKTPVLLRYHTMLLNILAGCAVGRANITTVEAKLQSLYQYENIMLAIADPCTIVDVKIGLMNLFFEAYIEVEITIPGLNKSPEFWQCAKSLIEPPKEIAEALLSGRVSVDDMRKMMHFVYLSAKVVDGFLEVYYEGTEFRNEDKLTSVGGDNEEDDQETSMHWIDKTFFELYHSFKTLYDLKSPMVTDDQNRALYRAMDTLSISTEALSAVDLPLHVDVLIGDPTENEEKEVLNEEVAGLRRFIKEIDNDEDLQDTVREDRTNHLVALIDKLPRQADDVVAEIRYEPTLKKLISHTRNLIKKEKGKKFIPRDCVDTAIWTIQLLRAMIETKWTESLHKREGPEAGKMGIDERDDEGEEEEDEAAGPVQDALDECGASILCLDVIADGMNEVVVEEGVNLLVALMFREGGNKKVQATIFEHLNQRGTGPFFEEIRNRLRKMMEWHQDKVIEQEDDAKDKARSVQSASDSGKEDEGALDAGDECMAKRQKTRIGGMKSSKWSEEPFKATVEKIHEDGSYDIRYHGDGHIAKKVPADFVEAEDEEVDQPDGIILVRAIQLMSEGHFEDNQDICREQPNNHKSFNLLDDFVNYLAFLSKNPCKESTEAGIKVAGTILEVIQGPCVENQKHFAMNTELIEILNRMMRIKGGPEADEDSEDELKKTGLEIFEALLEGQSKGSEIYERILSVIHLDVLQVMACDGASDEPAVDEGEEDEGDENGEKEEEEEEDEGMGEVQTEALVLMQMLCDYKPSLRDEIQWPPEIEAILGRDVVSVEVIWNGVLQRRFFPIPDMCHDLADASKNKLVEEVPRDSQETKLTGLMEDAKILYIEIKHQQVLKDSGLASIFSRGNQERATWISFFLACLINFLLLVGYKWGEPGFDGVGTNIYLEVAADEGARNGGMEPTNQLTFLENLAKVGMLITGTGQLDKSWDWVCDWPAHNATHNMTTMSIIDTVDNFEAINNYSLPMKRAAFLEVLTYGTKMCPEGEDGYDWCLDLCDDDGNHDYLGKDWTGETCGMHQCIRPQEPGLEPLFQVMTRILNVFQCITSIFVFILFLVVRCPVRYQVGIEHKEMSEIGSLMYTATDSMTLYYLTYVVVATLCINNQYFCCLLLLDIIIKDSTTRDVLNAVIYPIKQLSMTVVLMTFAINIFQTMIFFFFHDHFVNGDLKHCDTMADCFLVTLDYGLRSSGGIGDQMTNTLDIRAALDLLYFVLVLVILLNVVFGIIIDTFSELRQKKMERLDDTFNMCFICGHEKVTFDRAYDSPKGFEMHIKEDHNMWNYLFFMIFVWEQDRDDDDGLELFVRLQADNMDVSWFPMNRALCLVTDTKKEDTIGEKVDKLEETFEGIMTTQNSLLIKNNDKHFGAVERNIKVVSKRMEETFFATKQAASAGGGSITSAGGDGTEETGKKKNLFSSNFSFIGSRGVATPQGEESIPRAPGFVDHFPEGGSSIESGGSEGDRPSSRDDNKRATMLMAPPPGSRYAKIAILGATELAAPHLFGTSDPFIVGQVYWNDEKVGETDTIWLSQTPKWENSKANAFHCPLWASEAQNAKMARLRVCLYHAHRRGLGHFLGQVEMNWTKLNDMKNGKPKYFPLKKKVGANKASQRMVQGEVRIAVAFQKQDENPHL